MLSPSTIFREEALAERLRGGPTEGDLLRLSPRWTNWSYWLLVAVFVAGFCYVVFGGINDYAAGAALIRDEGRTSVTAITGGTISQIAVRPGQHVAVNQLLLRFNDAPERIELERLHRELNVQQIHRLKNPNDALAQQQLATIRAQIETAEKRIEERIVRAPRAGLVGDLRIRLNQLVAPGESLLTIVGDHEALSVIAILPGQARPLLKRGDLLRLELTGFRYAYQRLRIDSVGDEVVGPNEVRRFLGQELADALIVPGPSVIVRAHLPSRKFKAAGRWHEYHEGMQGIAEARVRSESMLFVLVPGLQALFEGRGD